MEKLLQSLLESGQEFFGYGWNIPGFVGFSASIPMSTLLRDTLKCLEDNGNQIVKILVSFVKRLTRFDQLYHFDVISKMRYQKKNGIQFWRYYYFDVKDVEPENAGTGNYTISTEDRDECLGAEEEEHWFAFRLNVADAEGKCVRLKSFACVRATEALDRRNLARAGNETLYSLPKIWKNSRQKFVVGDKKDMERFLKYHGQAA